MNLERIVACYDRTADAYAEHLFDELSKKPLDRMLLRQFAEEHRDAGTMVDLGCGPGQTTKFLAEHGVNRLIGIDLSPDMIETAKRLNPRLSFRVGDMLKLDDPDAAFGSAVAFYAIVHFDDLQLRAAFQELHRVLKPGGQCLLAFHVGNDLIHRDELFGVPVDIDFYFFQTADILDRLREAGFNILDALERQPYEGAEHPSRRAYVRAENLPS